MHIKLIAADLDGTLLNRSSCLSERTQAVLSRCAAEGIKLVAATGRAYDAMPACILESGLFDYAITSNGAGIYNTKKALCLQRYVIEESSARTLIKFALRRHLGLEMICGGKAYGERYYFEHPQDFGFEQRSLDYLYSTRTKIEDLDAFLAENIHHLESIDFILPHPEMKTRFAAAFAADTALYITSSYPRILEFSSRACGKANALRYLLQKEKLLPEQVAAFGNAENDVEMLQLAAIGVATANSPPEVRKKVRYTCGDCDRDGVAEFIEQRLHL
ncbi:MAG: Cof-type HAD-IIB family hydrolase, partial [Clostridia bacterium]|nr:Cof-type HAD-IIB family hydrolase [Clostridia bacterium]